MILWKIPNRDTKPRHGEPTQTNRDIERAPVKGVLKPRVPLKGLGIPVRQV